MASGAILRVFCVDGPCQGAQFLDLDTGRVLFSDATRRRILHLSRRPRRGHRESCRVIPDRLLRQLRRPTAEQHPPIAADIDAGHRPPSKCGLRVRAGRGMTSTAGASGHWCDPPGDPSMAVSSNA